MSKHEYRAKYRGYTVFLDRETATYWWQGGNGYQSMTKCLLAIDEFKATALKPHTDDDHRVHWTSIGKARTV